MESSATPRGRLATERGGVDWLDDMAISFNSIINHVSAIEQESPHAFDAEEVISNAESVLANELQGLSIGEGKIEVFIQIQYDCIGMPGAKTKVTISPIKPSHDIYGHIPISREEAESPDAIAIIRRYAIEALNIIGKRLDKKNITHNISQAI